MYNLLTSCDVCNNALNRLFMVACGMCLLTAILLVARALFVIA